MTIVSTSPAQSGTYNELTGIRILASPVEFVESENGTIVAVLRDHTRESFDVIYPALGCRVRSELATRLGAAQNEVGCLQVDSYQRTTIKGLYAIGDVVSDLHQIAVGTGHAAIAATHIHNALPSVIR